MYKIIGSDQKHYSPIFADQLHQWLREGRVSRQTAAQVEGAFVLDILGLRFRRSNPTAGGAVHAWIGIVPGGLCGFGYLALTIIGIVAATSKR